MFMNKNIKEKGQVFTPSIIVNMILDNINYNGKEILYKKILEPSFGEGIFLIEIVKRIIKEGEKNNIKKETIEKLLNENIYGIEYDEILFNKTILKLNNLLEIYGLKSSWNNLIKGDTTYLYKKYINTFDFIVGNPPYVRTKNLLEEFKNNIKELNFINGNKDLYICFYEICIKMLNCNGKLGFITSNSFMKNSSQKNFRNYIIENELLEKIYDFKTSKIFKGINIYSCICILNKYNLNKKVEYREYDMYKIVMKKFFQYDYLKEKFYDVPWNFNSMDNMNFLEENSNKPIKFEDIATIQNGIATNKDDIYIGQVYIDKQKTKPYMGKNSDKEQLVYFNDCLIESSILYRCVKISKYTGEMSNLYILFPYVKDINNYIPIDEKELQEKYPNAYNYLLKNKNILSLRNMEHNSKWYSFGRSQGLLNISCKKVIFKRILLKNNPIVEPYILDEDVIVYSGLYISINKKTDSNLILSILKEDDFKKYCVLTGKDMSGGYVFVSSKNIKKYGINSSKFSV